MSTLLSPLSAAITPRCELWVSWTNGPFSVPSFYELPLGTLLVPGAQTILTLDGRLLRGHALQLKEFTVRFQRGFLLIARFWMSFCYDFVVALYSLIARTYPETMRAEAEAGKTRLAQTAGELGQIYEESLMRLFKQEERVKRLEQDTPPEEYDTEIGEFQRQLQISNALFELLTELDDNERERTEGT